MPFLKNFLCCLPLRQGCMWMAKGAILTIVCLMIIDIWNSIAIQLPFYTKPSTVEVDTKTFIVQIAGLIACILQHFGAKYNSRVLLIPTLLICIAAEIFFGRELYLNLTKNRNKNASAIKYAFKHKLKNRDGKIEPLLLTLLYYIIAYAVILYMWILVFSFLLRLQKAVKMENCKENDTIKGQDLTIRKPLGKSESGNDLFVVAMKE